MLIDCEHLAYQSISKKQTGLCLNVNKLKQATKIKLV